MKKLTGFTLLLMSALVTAETCDSSTPLMASYKIKAQQHHGDHTIEKHLTLWRNQTSSAIQYGDTNITEFWEPVKGNRLRLVRYFDSFQRGIEYQPNEISGDHNWSLKQQLVSDEFLQSMTEKKRAGSGCQEVVYLEKKQGNVKVALQWLPKQKLIKQFSEESPKGHVDWSLVKTSHNTAAVSDRFQQLSDFNTVDYTDIGDNESDPFLAQMINLGFVEHGAKGFYDSDGHSMSGSKHRH